MFGISDPQIWISYVLAIVFALACIVYGILNWNSEEESNHGG